MSERGMPRWCWEDLTVGRVIETGARSITAEEIKAFAVLYDPQDMHIDEEAARHTMMGGLCASGWHTACLMFRMIYDSWLHDSSSMGSPGIDEIRWHKPVRPGETLIARVTVLERRISKSKPDRGFTTCLFEVFTAPDTCVMTLKSSFILGLRDPAAAPASAS
jgi:acyl dehydratase